MLGWIICLWDEFLPSPLTRQEIRQQPPLFYVHGEPVFEVWFWHTGLKRWFVKSKAFNTLLEQQGVVYFDSPAELIAKVRALGGTIPDRAKYLEAE